jgi:hypothetical protein
MPFEEGIMPHTVLETAAGKAAPPRSLPARYSDAQARELWKHEDHLISARVQWLCLTQGLLFAAYGVAIQLPEATVKNTPQLKEFLIVVPAAGVWISLLALIGIASAFCAMAIIHRGARGGPQPEGSERWDRPGVSLPTTVGGAVCALGIPLMFAAIWLKVMQLTVSGFFWATVDVARQLVR